MTATDTETARREEILAAARSVFADYGFQRASLHAIAREAGISRTGLYHYFGTKDEVFRAACELIHERAFANADRAAASDAPVAERLTAVLEAKLGWFYKLLHASRHGKELADETNRISGDLVAASARRYLRLVTRVFAEADAAGELDLASQDLTPERAAVFLVRCAEGLRGPAANPPSPAVYRERLQQLVSITMAGLGRRA